MSDSEPHSLYRQLIASLVTGCRVRPSVQGDLFSHTPGTGRVWGGNFAGTRAAHISAQGTEGIALGVPVSIIYRQEPIVRCLPALCRIFNFYTLCELRAMPDKHLTNATGWDRVVGKILQIPLT